MAAAWFKGVQRRICLDYNDTDTIRKEMEAAHLSFFQTDHVAD